jgi:hypothetical protein
MPIVLADVEADGLRPSVIHCVCLKINGVPYSFTDMTEFKAWVDCTEALEPITWVFHNGLNYDVGVINRLTDVTIDEARVIDTFVVSRLKDYNKFRTHSLKELGEYLGTHKGDYTGGWDVCTEEMVTYCEQDVEVLESVYEWLKPFIFDKNNKKALRMEHGFASICTGMSKTGFPFKVDDAKALLTEVEEEMEELEAGFNSLLSGKRKEKKRIKLRYKKDGDLFPNCIKTLATEDCEIIGDEIVVYHDVEFNAGSPKQRIDALWDYGWKPVDKTVGHLKSLRRKR